MTNPNSVGSQPRPERSIGFAFDTGREIGRRVLGNLQGSPVAFVKIGAHPDLSLARLTDDVRDTLPQAEIIADLQKFGTEPSNPPGSVAQGIARGGAETVIVAPFLGPKVFQAHVEAAREAGLDVIMAGCPPQGKGIYKREGGYLDDDMPWRSLAKAATIGVTRFVVTPPRLAAYAHAAYEHVGEEAQLYVPGLKHGATIPDENMLGRANIHGIFGSDFVNSDDPRFTAQRLQDLVESIGWDC